MPEIYISARFKKAYRNLPEQLRQKVKKAMRLLAEDIRYPSLRTKPVQGASGVYEARVDRGCRMTYERLPGDALLMRVVGKHDEVLRNP